VASQHPFQVLYQVHLHTPRFSWRQGHLVKSGGGELFFPDVFHQDNIISPRQWVWDAHPGGVQQVKRLVFRFQPGFVSQLLTEAGIFANGEVFTAAANYYTTRIDHFSALPVTRVISQVTEHFGSVNLCCHQFETGGGVSGAAIHIGFFTAEAAPTTIVRMAKVEIASSPKTLLLMTRVSFAQEMRLGAVELLALTIIRLSIFSSGYQEKMALKIARVQRRKRRKDIYFSLSLRLCDLMRLYVDDGSSPLQMNGEARDIYTLWHVNPNDGRVGHAGCAAVGD
jgi:hypothetical protein